MPQILLERLMAVIFSLLLADYTNSLHHNTNLYCSNHGYIRRYVTADGGATVTARGVCWATTANPNLTNSYTSDGTGTGVFTSSITGLTANTPYHVRAYATNIAGTAYGSDLQFTTLIYLHSV